MSMYFRFTLFFIFLLSSFQMLCEGELMKERMYKYNNLKFETLKLKVDSTKLLVDLNQFIRMDNKVYSSHILRVRVEEKEYETFFYLLIFLLFLSVLRYLSFSSINFQLLRFIKIKAKNTEAYGLFKSVFISILFAFLLSYVLFNLYEYDVRSFSKIYSTPLFLLIVFTVFLYLVFRYFINFLLSYVFEIKNKLNQFHFLFIDLLYIFVSISLPVLLFSSIVNHNIENIINISVLSGFILMYISFIIKLYYNSLGLILRNVIKFSIYFFVVEIIPILLLLKYIRTVSISY